MKRLLFALLFVVSQAWGQGLETIALSHRSAEALLPQLAPFVEPGGAITGAGDRIFLRASARNRAEIAALAASLDTPLRRLLVQVRQAGSDTRSGSGAGLGARVEVGAGGTAVALRGHLGQTDASTRRDIRQQVQTIEGGRAAIMVGESYILPLRQVVLTPAGAVVSESLVQRDLGTGFVVVPRLAGDRVTLDISPRDDVPGPVPGSVNSTRLVTTVSGRLGEWLELGASDRTQGGDGTTLTTHAARSATQTRHLQLRVDELP